MRTLLIIIVAAVGLTACGKNGVRIQPGFFGKYELRREYGGLSYRDSTYKPGNGTLYQFNSDSTYKHFTKGKPDTQGVYHIRMNTDPTSVGIAPRVIYFDNTQYGEPFTSKGTTITIGTSADDGIAADYEKVGN